MQLHTVQFVRWDQGFFNVYVIVLGLQVWPFFTTTTGLAFCGTFHVLSLFIYAMYQILLKNKVVDRKGLLGQYCLFPTVTYLHYCKLLNFHNTVKSSHFITFNRLHVQYCKLHKFSRLTGSICILRFYRKFHIFFFHSPSLIVMTRT